MTTSSVLVQQANEPTIPSTTTMIMKGDDSLTTTKTNLSFLSLPPEIRNEIYTHLFANVTLGISTIHSTGPLCPGSFCSCLFPYGIVHTCRLIRSETTPLLLSATTLEVTNRIEKTSLLPDHFLSLIPRAVVLDAKILSTIPTMSTLTSRAKVGFHLIKFQSLRVLELRNISVWCQYYECSYLESPAADECMVNLAMFNLRRISSVLTDLCDDKERTFRILLGCQFVGNSMRHETVQAVIDVDRREVVQKTKGDAIKTRNSWAGFY